MKIYTQERETLKLKPESARIGFTNWKKHLLCTKSMGLGRSYFVCLAAVRWGEFVTICVIILVHPIKVYNISHNNNNKINNNNSRAATRMMMMMIISMTLRMIMISKENLSVRFYYMIMSCCLILAKKTHCPC